MIQLSEPELRDVRYLLDTLLTRADQLLDTVEHDMSLNFTGLSIDPGKSQHLLILAYDTHFFQRTTIGLGTKTLARCLFQPLSRLLPRRPRRRLYPALAVEPSVDPPFQL